MNKLKLAHDWAMVFTQHNKDLSVAVKTVSAWAFDYADAMQAEADKREDKTRPEVLEEWQPDWGQAPDGADSWAMRPDGKCLWWKGKPLFDGSCFYDAVGICHTVGYAPSFGYIGNWQDSLRKRPQ